MESDCLLNGEALRSERLNEEPEMQSEKRICRPVTVDFRTVFVVQWTADELLFLAFSHTSSIWFSIFFYLILIYKISKSKSFPKFFISGQRAILKEMKIGTIAFFLVLLYSESECFDRATKNSNPSESSKYQDTKLPGELPQVTSERLWRNLNPEELSKNSG